MMKKIKNWPIEKKKIFSISLAGFLTLLIMIFWIGFRGNSEENPSIASNSPIATIQDSMKEIIDQFNEGMAVISSSTDLLNSTTTDNTISTTSSSTDNSLNVNISSSSSDTIQATTSSSTNNI